MISQTTIQNRQDLMECAETQIFGQWTQKVKSWCESRICMSSRVLRLPLNQDAFPECQRGKPTLATVHNTFSRSIVVYSLA